MLDMDLSISRRRGAGRDWAAEVQALLAGSAGFAFDPADAARLWQDAAKTIPVSAIGQPIGAIDTKFGSTVYTFTEAAPAQGQWTGQGWSGDGVDDRFVGVASALLNNVPAATYIGRVRFSSLTAQPALIAYSTATATNSRLVVDVLSTGAIRIRCRRLDADTETSVSSAAGVIVAGNAYTIRVEVNYATGFLAAWINGVGGAPVAIGGTPGNTSASNSARVRFSLGLSSTLSQFLHGIYGRCIVAPRILTAGEVASCVGYVEAAAV